MEAEQEGISSHAYFVKDEDFAEINDMATIELKQDPKYINFVNWALDNGAKFPRLDYPVAFGKNGLVGIGAKEDIGPCDAMMMIPNKMLITEDKFRNSEIGFMLTKHRYLFKEHFDQEYLVLIVFIMWELCKGEQSFWHHYFECAGWADLPYKWTDEELKEMEDDLLEYEIKEYREEVEEEWTETKKVLDLYPEHFPPEKINKEMFEKAYNAVVSRCFGWCLPGTIMAPFADCINHYNADSQYEMLNTRLHYLTAEERQQVDKKEKGYYTKSKMQIDFSDVFADDNEEKRQQAKIKDKHYKADMYKRKSAYRVQTLAMSMEELNREEDKQVWDLDYMSTSDEEDNDTDESSDEEEESEEEAEEDTPNGGEGGSDNEAAKEDEEVKASPKVYDMRDPEVKEEATAEKPRKRRRKEIISYTYDPETNERTVVVKKKMERREPENLIDLLIMKKQSLYERE